MDGPFHLKKAPISRCLISTPELQKSPQFSSKSLGASHFGKRARRVLHPLAPESLHSNEAQWVDTKNYLSNSERQKILFPFLFAYLYV